MRNLLAIMCFFGLIAANAQTSVIRGKAIDGTSKKGIEFATVVLLKATDSTLIKGSLTDTVGNFEINYLSAGAYILSISSIEYQKIYKGPLVIDADGQTLDVGMLEMGTDQKLLAEVVVKGEKLPFEHHADKLVMNVASSSLYKASTNALDVLKKAPGLQIKADGSILMRNSITPKFFVDGKDIPMTGDELKNYLNALTPDMIESIEIISNPSSKYDAQYKGIVNIKLKRDKNLGLQGNYGLTFSQNVYSSYNNNLMLGYKTKKVAYSARLGYNDYGSLYIFNSNQQLTNGSRLLTDTQMPTLGKDLSYQLGIDFKPKNNQEIGIVLKGYNKNANQNTETTNIIHTSEATQPNLLTINQAKPQNTNISGTIHYDIDFKKNHLSFLATIANFNNSQTQDIQSKQQNTLVEYLKSNLNNDVKIKSSQLDYNTPIWKGQLDAGLKVASTYTNNDLRFDKLQGDKFVVDNKRTNRFTYEEDIFAGYFNYSRELKKFAYQLGLRVENTDTKSVSITTDKTVSRNYYRWLPSSSFYYKLSDVQGITLSYSSRLRRPNFEELNPFQFYISPYTYAEGNPFLLPTQTNITTLSYNYKDFGISFNMGKDHNPINQLPFYNSETNVTAYLRQNVKVNDFAYSEANYTFSVAKWWRLQHNAGLYYNNNHIVYNGKEYSKGVVSYIIGGSQVFTLPKNITFDLSYNYYSANGDVFFKTNAMYDVNIGLQKTFFKDKLNTKLNFNDIFYSYVPKMTFQQTDILVFNSYQKYASRRLIVQLNYNFGKSTYKSRSKGRTEEENRASK